MVSTMEVNKITQAKIDIVEAWVKLHGQIWSRKVLYQLVSAGLVKDTSKSTYVQVCKLFMKLRREGIIPYEWFKDKKTVALGVGIDESRSFDERFKLLCKYFTKDSKSLQKYYVEIWTEKELPEDITQIIKYKYQVGLVTSEGFVGDVAQHNAVKRLEGIREEFELPIVILYVSDYDCEGEHIFGLMKEELGGGGIEVRKIAIKKEDVKRFELISNIGYRERMLKPNTLKYHMRKGYVRDFLGKNKDLERDGIVQYEIEAYPDESFKELIERELNDLISLKIIAETHEICRGEAKEWLEDHYME